ncbi:MAG: acetyltransferase [Bacteroidetes bacterium GWD2_45_23]|nr:MAG: acetyltransferase [Bacteroidetes bacterium GWC2_46_850]OFX65582.1 MAG: acetyltransferase [Bacteroidetes bacterium GWC1_47_7]OFX86968.1 MAG: acetyltransferase [Bacteroidetes bacterium GWD2_45_23]HAR38754.1 acetyltransferase [Porphyromonadaceae bacterium]HBB00477.1 acetyltransferase [Porphyromonadaceae bacterium]
MDDENNKNGIGYTLLYIVAYLHALLPFSVLYLFSDILFFLIYYLVRYRRKLVRRNLKNAFPEESQKEIVKLEREFYHHLCDYFVETIKTLHLSDKEVSKRLNFENPEIFNRLTANGKSCILSLGHYGNWEWVPSIVMHFQPEMKQGLVYKTLHNKAFDRLFLKIRSRFNSKPIEQVSVYRQMIRLKEAGERMVVGFLADQRPFRNNGQYWTTFLNQDTLVQTGMEKIAQHLGCAVVYLDIQKVKRGYYEGKFFVISSDASQEQDFVIMERYMRKLEETILSAPAYYLWSHNRWKFKKTVN